MYGPRHVSWSGTIDSSEQKFSKISLDPEESSERKEKTAGDVIDNRSCIS